MRFKSLKILLGISTVFIFLTHAGALDPAPDFFWISPSEKRIKEKDGSVSCVIDINYGIFPDNKKEYPEMEYLKMFYSTEKTDSAGNLLYYELPVEKTDGVCRVRVNATSKTQYTIIMEAGRTAAAHRYYYSAETAFILFGHAARSQKELKSMPIDLHHSLDVSKFPKFDYWPQTANPITFSFTFKKRPLVDKSAVVYDENLRSEEIISGQDGWVTFVPADDKKLNMQEECSFKTFVILLRMDEGDSIYLTSFSQILHRSRTGNRNLAAGVILFASTAFVLVFFVILWRRKERI